MPEESKALLPNVMAGIGYAVSFFACLIGVPVVLIVLGITIAFDLARGLGNGTFRERLRKPRW